MGKVNPVNLFEYNWNKHIPEEILGDKKFESFLDDIWVNRPKVENWYHDGNDESKSEEGKQRFIRFRTNEFSPRNYVGVIRFNNTEINFLPKIFYENGKLENLNEEEKKEEIQNIHLHILYWLSYTKRISFPKSLSSLDNIKINSFFEILILTFATYTREALNRVLYQNYTDVNRDNQFIKGRLDVNGYIRNNITTGNWQRITCDYDSFEVDNRFNRIIKYVSKMLLPHTNEPQSQKLLQEIVFLLDDVEDEQMTYDDCEKVHLNPFYKELNSVLDYCKLFLSNSMVYSYKDQFEVFAFLLPMEKIFEEFVVGFLEENPRNSEEISQWKIESQKSDTYISEKPKNAFQMKPDIYLEKSDKKLIIDTKYKVLKNGNDNKKGVSQSDMYQMVSYAIRFEVRDIVLLYPGTISDTENYEGALSTFEVNDKFANNQQINISIHKLPIIAYLDEYKKNYLSLKKKLDQQVTDKLNTIL